MVQFYQTSPGSISDGQVTLTLPFSYVVGASELLITLNGQVAAINDQYTEVGNLGSFSTTITFNFALSNSDVIEARSLRPVTPGSITTANLLSGSLGISYVASNRTSGLLDLKLEVRDPANLAVISNVPLTEYYGTGAYYAQAYVGEDNPGAYLAIVTSLSAPTNNAIKLFLVEEAPPASTGQGGGSVVQEASRDLGDTFTFRHVAQSGLTDVQVSIYDAAQNSLVLGQQMLELAPTTGVYNFAFTPTTAGLYVGVMSSEVAGSRSVAEVLFRITSGGGTGSTVISNVVGVGTRC